MKRVIKIGGRAQSSPELAQRIASAWKDAPGSFCIVHGGGDEISALQRRLGSEPSFVNGRRFTSAGDIEIVRMILSGLVNKRLVSSLTAVGIPAVGISGEDAKTISATAIDPERLGRTGKPNAVNVTLIRTLLDSGYLPVISPLASEDSGSPGDALNVNSDDAAAAIAIALDASELLLIVDVAGVLDAAGNAIENISQPEASRLIQSGVINSGMRAKLEAGFSAVAGNVGRVRISGLDGLGAPMKGTLLAVEEGAIT